MTWVLPFAVGMVLLVGLFAAGVPIFAAFLLLNIGAVFWFFGPSGFGLFANSMYATATDVSLATVPLFIIMGEILFRSGAMEALFEALDRLVGRVRGRQYVLGILLSAVFGALSGSAIAVAGFLGRSLLPAMIERGYDRKLSVGCLLGGAGLAPIIPPSVLAVLVSAIAGVSTAAMLIAGILPGLLLTVIFLAYVTLMVWLKPELAPAPDRDEPGVRKISALKAALRMIPCVFVFFTVMGLIMLGIATPTEAAATGAVGAVLAGIYYGGLTVKVVLEALKSAVLLSALLLVIMCSSVMFSQLLTFTGASRAMATFIVGLDVAPMLMLLLLLGLPFVLFLFLDQIAIMLVLVPIYKPVLGLYGIDPIWFWTLFLITATVGGLSPPFGYVLFAMKAAVPKMPVGEIYSAAWPFVWLFLFGIVLMALFPGIVTYLPELSAGR